MRGIRGLYSRQVHEKERNEDGRYTIRVTFFFLSLINLRKYYALHEMFVNVYIIGRNSYVIKPKL